ncbi:chromate transporter [Paenibacillus thermotolerans]|uniref:chromate transporter n=1 Tax=Paenibacillus thermotolerans TaxID=3027807 RepID=UPI0023683052|nr:MULTISPECIES: chromate transporter [unclassified Paenibacillus]
MKSKQSVGEDRSRLKRLLEVLGVSAKLGLTSFGGPIAHLGYFHDEYIRRRKWMDERSYSDIVALCQFLPGPASSQVGIGIGIMRAGLLGGLLAFIGFTLPSVIVLVLFAMLVQGFDAAHTGWIHGLKVIAVAIVAHAIWGMGQKLTPDRNRITIAIVSAGIALLWQTAVSQVAIIIAAGLLGLVLYKEKKSDDVPQMNVPIPRYIAVISLVLFFALLMLLPVAKGLAPSGWLSLFDSFYRSGSLVFGGGHVVLPLLERELVPAGWVSEAEFLAGYGATQAVPGPMFTFAAYLGAVINGWAGALIATAGIFLPAFLLVIGTLPFWNKLRRLPKVQGAFVGINAAVVGILLAAWYDPIWTSSIVSPADFVLASVLFIALAFWKLPPWIVVLLGALGGTLTTLL